MRDAPRSAPSPEEARPLRRTRSCPFQELLLIIGRPLAARRGVMNGMGRAASAPPCGPSPIFRRHRVIPLARLHLECFVLRLDDQLAEAAVLLLVSRAKPNSVLA